MNASLLKLQMSQAYNVIIFIAKQRLERFTIDAAEWPHELIVETEIPITLNKILPQGILFWEIKPN